MKCRMAAATPKSRPPPCKLKLANGNVDSPDRALLEPESVLDPMLVSVPHDLLRVLVFSHHHSAGQRNDPFSLFCRISAFPFCCCVQTPLPSPYSLGFPSSGFLPPSSFLNLPLSGLLPQSSFLSPCQTPSLARGHLHARDLLVEAASS